MCVCKNEVLLSTQNKPTCPRALVKPNRRILEMMPGYRSVNVKNSQTSPVHSTTIEKRKRLNIASKGYELTSRVQNILHAMLSK